MFQVQISWPQLSCREALFYTSLKVTIVLTMVNGNTTGTPILFRCSPITLHLSAQYFSEIGTEYHFPNEEPIREKLSAIELKLLELKALQRSSAQVVFKYPVTKSLFSKRTLLGILVT